MDRNCSITQGAKSQLLSALIRLNELLLILDLKNRIFRQSWIALYTVPLALQGNKNISFCPNVKRGRKKSISLEPAVIYCSHFSNMAQSSSWTKLDFCGVFSRSKDAFISWLALSSSRHWKPVMVHPSSLRAVVGTGDRRRLSWRHWCGHAAPAWPAALQSKPGTSALGPECVPKPCLTIGNEGFLLMCCVTGVEVESIAVPFIFPSWECFAHDGVGEKGISSCQRLSLYEVFCSGAKENGCPSPMWTELVVSEALKLAHKCWISLGQVGSSTARVCGFCPSWGQQCGWVALPWSIWNTEADT